MEQTRDTYNSPVCPHWPAVYCDSGVLVWRNDMAVGTDGKVMHAKKPLEVPFVSEQSDLLLLCKLPALVTHTLHCGLILNLAGNMRLSGLSKEGSSPFH